MNVTFEQRKHLNLVIYRRRVRFVGSIFLAPCSLLSVMCVLNLGRRAAAGESLSAGSWFAAGRVGILLLVLIRLGFLWERSRRRYVEFRCDKVFLSQRGGIADKQIITWSLLPDLVDSQYTRLQLVYRFGLGQKRWSMLLDEDTQIAALRETLKLKIPLKGAG